MELNGFISTNWDGWAVVGTESFADFMYHIAEDYGFAGKHHKGLGGKRAFIKNCKIVMYTTTDEMTFEEAQEKFLDRIFGVEHEYDGEFEMQANYTGYSEWTITGFDLDTCTLGGHDMNSILLSHTGEFANIRVEIE